MSLEKHSGMSQFLTTSDHLSFVVFRPATLMIEQPFLAPQTAAVSAERAVGSNHAMTWNDDANHVRSIGATNCATRVFIAEAPGHPRIGTRFANWNRLQDLPC